MALTGSEKKKAMQAVQAKKTAPTGKPMTTPASSKPQPIGKQNAMAVPPTKRRPQIGSNNQDDVAKFVEAFIKLEEETTYTGSVQTSCKFTSGETERYKLVIEMEDGNTVTFGEPFPFNSEYPAGRLFADNPELLQRLSSLEKSEVTFSIHYTQGKNGRTYMNLSEIAFLLDDDSEDDDGIDEEEANVTDEEEEEEIDDDDDVESFFEDTEEDE